MMRYYLGIDIGTFESKGCLVDESGTIVASAARPHKMLVPQAGRAEHRAEEDWWGDFTFISKKLIAESRLNPADIKAVATSGIGPCMLPVDKNGAPLMNAVLYGVDTRAAKEIDELNAQIGEERILDFCGNALTSQSVGPKILWLKKNHPELFVQTHKILNCNSYLNFRLTGRYVIDHYSASSSAPLYDPSNLCWSDELTKDIISLDKLPECGWSTEIAGEISKKAAGETGLAAGTPVTFGTIDAAAEAISVGVLSPGDMMMMYGSTIFIIALTNARIRDARLWYAPWLFPNQHASMAGLATSGTLTHWFRDNFAKEMDVSTAASVLTKEASASPPGANGLITLPYFSGERTPIHDTSAKGMILGLNLTHTRADMFRSVLEGIAYGTHHVLQTFDELGGAPKNIFAVGGGTKNQVWSQATSDVSGKTQTLREKSIGASYGNAFLAAMALGDVKANDIKVWNPVVAEIKPQPLTAAIYSKQYEMFRELYRRNKDLMHAL